MLRVSHDPRPDWRERAGAMGFSFAEIAGEAYWDETAHWRFTAAEVDTLEDATNELQRLCLHAAEHAVRFNKRDMLGLSDRAWDLAVRSWERGEPSLYGRMDLRWDGSGPPVLLEYNADTPTALFEAAVVQWEWLSCAYPAMDQFNSIHEALIAAWPAMRLPPAVHFCAQRDSDEDRGTVDYLRDTALQAGLQAPFLHMDEIGWNGTGFVDMAEREIRAAFKLYPWEWMMRDEFGANIHVATTRWIEPPWRMLLSGKGVLALLWELFPGHPNLLPAFRKPGRTGAEEIQKPLWGREGANIFAPGGLSTPGPYGSRGSVWQAWAPLPCVDGRYPVLGSWIVAGKAVGLGIREDDTPITRDTSRFVPHLFEPHPEDA